MLCDAGSPTPPGCPSSVGWTWVRSLSFLEVCRPDRPEPQWCHLQVLPRADLSRASAFTLSVAPDGHSRFPPASCHSSLTEPFVSQFRVVYVLPGRMPEMCFFREQEHRDRLTAAFVLFGCVLLSGSSGKWVKRGGDRQENCVGEEAAPCHLCAAACLSPSLLQLQSVACRT